ncbi:MAG: hypothetical protein ACLPWS_14175 [Rhodomicrobium sp.]
MPRDYWLECIKVASDECGAALTEEQTNHIADTVRVSHDNYGMAFHQPESPYPGEIDCLTRELKQERSKVTCLECNGSGRIITLGPYHSGNSQCWKCRGEGKVLPAHL